MFLYSCESHFDDYFLFRGETLLNILFDSRGELRGREERKEKKRKRKIVVRKGLIKEEIEEKRLESLNRKK